MAKLKQFNMAKFSHSNPMGTHKLERGANVPLAKCLCTLCPKTLATHEHAVKAHLLAHVRRGELLREKLRETVDTIVRGARSE